VVRLIIFTAVLAAILIGRFLETFAQREKIKGALKAPLTFWLMTSVYIIVILVATVDFLYFSNDANYNYVVSGAGLVLYFFGLIVRNWCIKILGKYWSVHIEIRESHKLIVEGPYKYSRHPAYLAIAAEIVGICLFLNSYWAFLMAVLFFMPTIVHRIYIEEEEMVSKLGQEYLSYKKRVPVFFPFLKRRKKSSES
jgi:protein-S-isoprenylcysteine O-methyltransferase Ste14